VNDLIMADAVEYGHHVKQGGWRLGLLVARSVTKGAGTGGTTRSRGQVAKVSAEAFAKESGASRSTVTRHLDTWNAAAKQGLVPASTDLVPGQEVEISDDLREQWVGIYADNLSSGTFGKPTVSSAKNVIDKLTPSQRGEILADLVHDDQAYAEAPQHAKQELAGKLAEMFDTAKSTGKKKMNETSQDVHGWNHVQFAISDASENVAQATSEALHLQHGSEIANDKSMLGVTSALSRLDTNVREFKTLMGIKEEVPSEA
jgi:hypothetical protein